MLKQLASWQRLALSLIVCFALGAMQVFAFAPFNYWPLSFVSLAAFFYLSYSFTTKTAFLNGLIYGYGLYLVGVSWVYVSLSTYGGMPLWMGSIAVLGFAGILALFIGLSCYVVVRFFPVKQRLLVWPIVWLVFEWMKSWVLTGFPWLDLGYTQTSTWLFGWAPIGGVYLVSFLVLTLAAALVRVAQSRKPLAFAAVLAVVGISYWVNTLTWSQAVGEPLQVGIVQANVPITNKWQPEKRDELIAKYRKLSQKIQSENPADLIIWPETALPLYMQQTDSAFWKNIRPDGAALLTGIMDSPSIAQGNLDESYNAAVLSCQGEAQVYRKRHLVPFGEYLPLRFVFNWVLEYLELPMSDFSSWQGKQALECGAIKVGLSICYEDAFADEYRWHIGDATLLVNISEDAWFGDSFAPHQRAQMAQMRARELARPLVRSANSGPSLFIDERGVIKALTPQFSVHTMSRSVQPHTGDTPYAKIGNWIIWLSLLVLTGLLFRQNYSKG